MTLTIPRHPVSFFRLFWKMGGWIVIILTVLMLIATLISQLSLNLAKRFETEGREATAVVVEKYFTESTDSDGDRTVTYWLGLEFTTQVGEAISVKRTAGSSEYNRAEVGGEFDLLYLESEPETTELTEGSHRTGAKVGQIIALVFGLIWLGLLWLIGGWAVAAVRARRFGVREEATVTEVRRMRVRVNNRPRYRLIWTDSRGREGKSLMRKGRDLDGYRAGDTVEIYQGVKRAWWVGDVGERPEFSQ